MKAKQPWWNQVLLQLKKELDRKRRLGLHRTDRQTYIRARNVYLTEIRRAKMHTWSNFAKDINKNSWGKALRWAKNGTNQRKIPATMTKMDLFCNGHYQRNSEPPP